MVYCFKVRYGKSKDLSASGKERNAESQPLTKYDKKHLRNELSDRYFIIT